MLPATVGSMTQAAMRLGLRESKNDNIKIRTSFITNSYEENKDSRGVQVKDLCVYRQFEYTIEVSGIRGKGLV